MNKASYILSLLSAATLMVTSCAKVIGEKDNGTPLSFSVSNEMELETKGTQQTSVTSFTAAGYDGSTEWFPAMSVTTSGTYDAYKWKTGKTYTFFAYTNLPSSTSTAVASITEGGVSLNYKAVPESASDQNDMMLGYYSGNGGGTGTAAINFYHPLAAIKFTVGDIVGVQNISSIRISGVYASGTTSLAGGTGTPTFTWSNTSSTKTVSQTIAGNLPSKGSQLGTTFILIPQTISSSPKLSVEMSATLVDGKNKIITADLTSGTFEAGKTNIYAVNYTAGTGLSFSNPVVTAWGAGTDITAELEEKTGPDPNLWVDLGMVSATGHRLFISKYDVKSITNGQVTFATEDGDTKLVKTTSDNLGESTFISPDGLECRLPHSIELLDMGDTWVDYHSCGFVNFNWTTEQANYPYTFKCESKIPEYAEKSVIFTFISSNGYLTDENEVYWYDHNPDKPKFDIDSNKTSGYIKLVYEDLNTEYTPVKRADSDEYDCKITLSSKYHTWALFIGHPNHIEESIIATERSSFSLGRFNCNIHDVDSVAGMLTFSNGYKSRNLTIYLDDVLLNDRCFNEHKKEETESCFHLKYKTVEVLSLKIYLSGGMPDPE